MADILTPAERIAAIQAEDAARLAERRELDHITLGEVLVAAEAANASLTDMEAALGRLVGDGHRGNLKEFAKGNLSATVRSLVIVATATMADLAPKAATSE